MSSMSFSSVAFNNMASLVLILIHVWETVTTASSDAGDHTFRKYVFPWQLQRVKTVSMGEGIPQVSVMPRAGPGVFNTSSIQK